MAAYFGLCHGLRRGIRSPGLEIAWTDNRVWKAKFRIGEQPKLRAWQGPAVEVMRSHHQGIYKAPAGSGKTVAVLALIQQLACRSIVIVNTKDIVWQWNERAAEFLGESYPVGQIGDGIFDVSPYLTIATAQTLHSRFDSLEAEGFFDEFSLVCLDECFPAGTLISTPSGPRPIESLRAGDAVYGVNHQSGSVEATQVRHVFDRFADDLVELEGVEMTPNHPVSSRSAATCAPRTWLLAIPSRSMKREHPRTCEECGQDFLAWRPTGRFCSKRCATRALANRPDNPFKTDDGAIRAKSLSTRRAQGFSYLQGGNGHGLTEPQQKLWSALGDDWTPEYICHTGNPTRGQNRTPGIPPYYKIDLAHESRKIAVELDGEGHLSRTTRERDERKTAWLLAHGWTAIRVRNKDALHYLSLVLDRIASST